MFFCFSYGINFYKEYCRKTAPELSNSLDNLINQIKALPETDWRLIVNSYFPQIEELYKNKIYKAVEYIKTTPKLTCFTEDVTSLLMWAHYANKHTGYALEFDFTDIQNNCTFCPQKCNNEHYCELYPVVYSNNRFEATDFVGNYLMYDLQAQSSINLPIYNDDIYSIKKILLQKNKDWEYEKEWRLITVTKNCYFNRIQKRPKAIYVGVKATKETTNELLKIAKEINIPVYKMNYDYSNKEYKLNIIILQNSSI